MNARVVVAPRVARTLASHDAVVALETTVVTHGLPIGEGVRVALEMEAAIERSGAIPASIGVLDGAVRVGLPNAELQRLAASSAVEKLNLGNLAAAVAAGRSGSTTVAATIFIAARAGIEVFATGGIGGVHRGASASDDVSADLTALSRWPVAVVCAGAKAVLDLPRTIERLETLGVPVLGLRTDRFPAFYRREGGACVDARFDDIAALAAAVRAHFSLELGTGVVVANPVPAEHEMPATLYEQALEGALADAAARGVAGRDVTPFLLERMRERTGGLSVAVNRALLIHNARVAAELAVALAGGHGAR
ncbi:MAG: pseudouridine-5'-phosphate glycosidase [Candidatus Eisenbacteria bacterium]|nr:pseudouridine-5'-phosphate glycosidase [Candidatus Eisenbacteria bacterium]